MSENTSAADHTQFREAHKQLTARIRANPGVFLGIPTFLKALLRTASRGGSTGYEEAGFHFGYHVRDLEPYDTEDEEWLSIIEAELSPLVSAEEATATSSWLSRRYPRVMRDVPTRRRANFMVGFFRGFAKAGTA